VKKNLFKHQDGVSLVELLFVMGIFGIVIGAMYSLYSAQKRSAYTQDEVVEVQQNLRIAMDSITRDVRMAGMLLPYIPNTSIKTPPVQVAGNAAGIKQPLFSPDDENSDELTLNTASASATFARISPLNNASVYLVKSSVFSIPVDSPASVDSFNVGDHIRIVRPQDSSEPKRTTEALSTRRVYQITGTNRNAPSLTLTIDADYNDPTNIILNNGDMICKIASPYTTHPNTIRYCLGPAAACGPGATCPTGQLCLMRIVNGATTEVLAQNMAGFQIRYLMDDGSEVDAPLSPVFASDYSNIRAVRVTLTGQTMTTRGISGGQSGIRQIESVVQIRNR
jgi:prepilin-type N-terminal cleavage/methylation domain-containing protein